LYDYEVEYRKEGKVILAREGKFRIEKNNLELSKSGADLSNIADIVNKFDGDSLYAGKISEFIGDSLEVRPKIINEKISDRFTDKIWYFLLIVLLLSIEWAYRKIKGLN